MRAVFSNGDTHRVSPLGGPPLIAVPTAGYEDHTVDSGGRVGADCKESCLGDGDFHATMLEREPEILGAR